MLCARVAAGLSARCYCRGCCSFKRCESVPEPLIGFGRHRHEIRVITDKAERREWCHRRDHALAGRDLVHDDVAWEQKTHPQFGVKRAVGEWWNCTRPG